MPIPPQEVFDTDQLFGFLRDTEVLLLAKSFSNQGALTRFRLGCDLDLFLCWPILSIAPCSIFNKASKFFIQRYHHQVPDDAKSGVVVL